MRKVLIPLGIIAVIMLIGFFAYKTFINYRGLLQEGPAASATEGGQKASSTATSAEPTGTEDPLSGEGQVTVTPALENNSIALIIAFNDFKDEEFFSLRNLFLAAGSKVKIVSTQSGEARSVLGNKVAVDILLKDLQVKDFDAVVFIGGPGALLDLDNQDSYRIALETVSQGKILSAICIAPEILAKAGVLEGKKATVWTSETDQSGVQVLQDNGAIFQNQNVVTDGKIITSSGSEAAEELGMEIIGAIIP